MGDLINQNVSELLMASWSVTTIGESTNRIEWKECGLADGAGDYDRLQKLVGSGSDSATAFQYKTVQETWEQDSDLTPILLHSAPLPCSVLVLLYTSV